jgi:hypothetical protein
VPMRESSSSHSATAFASAFCSWSPNIMRPATKQPAEYQGEVEAREGVEAKEEKEKPRKQRRNRSKKAIECLFIAISQTLRTTSQTLCSAPTGQHRKRWCEETMVRGNDGALARFRGRIVTQESTQESDLHKVRPTLLRQALGLQRVVPNHGVVVVFKPTQLCRVGLRHYRRTVKGRGTMTSTCQIHAKHMTTTRGWFQCASLRENDDGQTQTRLEASGVGTRKGCPTSSKPAPGSRFACSGSSEACPTTQ